MYAIRSYYAKFAGGYTENAKHLVIGGPMTGKSVSTDRVPSYNFV